MSTTRYRNYDHDMLPIGSPEGERLLFEDLTIESNNEAFWHAVATQAANNAAVLRNRHKGAA